MGLTLVSAGPVSGLVAVAGMEPWGSSPASVWYHSLSRGDGIHGAAMTGPEPVLVGDADACATVDALLPLWFALVQHNGGNRRVALRITP
jgi:hypothetical protein